MTISSFCHAELLAHGPLSTDDLAARAVAAGVTRSRTPHTTVTSALRGKAVELPGRRWVAPAQLLEGRCLTVTSLRPPTWHGPDPDLALLGSLADSLFGPAAAPIPVPRLGEVLCLRVTEGVVDVSTVRRHDTETLEVFALEQRLPPHVPSGWHHRDTRNALLGVAQLLLDDPTALRNPVPPLTSWVPGLVRDDLPDRPLWWYAEDDDRPGSRVVLDDCQAIEVSLAAERAGVPARVWVADALDRALTASHLGRDDHRGVVISLGEPRRR